MLAGGAGLFAWSVHDANTHGPGTLLWDRIAVGLASGVGIMLLLAVPLSRLPVLTAMELKVVAQTAGSASVHVVATKPASRAMCTYIRTDSFVSLPDGLQIEVPRSVEGDPVLGNTRPPGRHDFGVWTVSYPAGLEPESVTFYGVHQCAWWMQPTITRIGPVRLR